MAPPTRMTTEACRRVVLTWNAAHKGDLEISEALCSDPAAITDEKLKALIGAVSNPAAPFATLWKPFIPAGTCPCMKPLSPEQKIGTNVIPEGFDSPFDLHLAFQPLDIEF